MGTYKSVEI